MARPPTYTSDDERPISVSLRMPKALYEQVQQRVQQRRMTLTEALLEGLQLWLETPVDPREVFLSDESNTVIQKLREELKRTLLDELRNDVQRLLTSATHTSPVVPYDTLPSNGNTVLQEETVKRCRHGHEPYPASRSECPGCVRERQRRKRERQAQQATP